MNWSTILKNFVNLQSQASDNSIQLIFIALPHARYFAGLYKEYKMNKTQDLPLTLISQNKNTNNYSISQSRIK